MVVSENIHTYEQKCLLGDLGSSVHSSPSLLRGASACKEARRKSGSTNINKICRIDRGSPEAGNAIVVVLGASEYVKT